MRYTRIGLYLLIFFCSTGYPLAQKEKIFFSVLINTNLSVFRHNLKEDNKFFDVKVWELLFSEAEKNIFDGDYLQAADNASRSQNLAQKLGDFFLEAKSYRLSGEIKLKKEQFYSAFADFQLAHAALFKIEKVPQNTVEAEFLKLGLDLVDTQATDELFASSEELQKASLNIESIIRLCDRHPNDGEFDEIKTSALIRRAKVMEIEQHYPAEIVLLEQIDTSDLASRNQVINLYGLNVGLLRAYRAIGNYEKSFESARQIEKLFPKLPFAEKSSYLRELAEFYSDTNNLPERDRVLDEARRLAETSENKYRLGVAISAQMLALMKDQRFIEAEKHFLVLKELSKDPEAIVNRLDLAVAAAVFASVRGETKESAQNFIEADQILKEFGNDPANARFLFYWKSFVATNEKRFGDLKSISLEYLMLAEDSKKIDSLPVIYFNLAKASYKLKNYEAARQYNKQVLALIGQKRSSKYAHISIGVAELSYRAYELQTSLDLLDKNTKSAFQIAEQSKGQFLADKISDSKKQSVEILESAKPSILEAAKAKAKNPDDKNLDAKLSAIEKLSVETVGRMPESDVGVENFLSELEKSTVSDDTLIVSYAFNADDKLVAFSWTRRQGLSVAVLDILRSQADRITLQTSQKIQNNLFFKQTGKEIFDLLLKPLNISSTTKHLIIIPDGSLWKIPFQAMSESGEKYLIEERRISYAVSVPILLNALISEKNQAQSAAVFANSNYQNTRLKFADGEAVFVAAEFNSKPILNARIEDFRKFASIADIVHFSMHAEINRTSPLASFLAFENGRLTVENLLDLKIKKGSLVFLASCNTDNVYNSEGLVSLAWGMTAAGAGGVISSQWEADDEAAGMFTKGFYASYKTGASRSEAIQQAAIEMINNKSGKNKPYYWAEFFLMGDYR